MELARLSAALQGWCRSGRMKAEALAVRWPRRSRAAFQVSEHLPRRSRAAFQMSEHLVLVCRCCVGQRQPEARRQRPAGGGRD